MFVDQIFDLGLVCEHCVSILQCGFCVNLCAGVNVLCLCVLCGVCIDALASDFGFLKDMSKNIHSIICTVLHKFNLRMIRQM